MKALKFLLITLVLLIINSCGVNNYHGDINFEYVNNRDLTPYSNAYGYHGYDVVFGEEYIVGGWVLYDTHSSDRIYTYFYEDGVLMMDDNRRYLYGVSNNGLLIHLSTGERIEIITSQIYRHLEGHPCYRVEISDQMGYETADMCPV